MKQAHHEYDAAIPSSPPPERGNFCMKTIFTSLPAVAGHELVPSPPRREGSRVTNHV